jgi:DNA-binding IclR family transcriptional regulator
MTPALEHTGAPRQVVPSGGDPLDRITREYQQMPGLRLTAAQAMRLFALDRAACARALNTLELTRFLTRDERDQYMRLQGS